jgi:hypothetical protein
VYRIGDGKIIAENIITRALSAISANLGLITGGQLQKDASSFWNLDTGEFRVGNSPEYEDHNHDGNDNPLAEYLHFVPGQGFFQKIKNFIVSSLLSILWGEFKVFRAGQDKTSLPVFHTNPGSDPQGGDKNHASSEFRGAFRVRKSNNPLFPNHDDTVLEALPNGDVNIPNGTLTAKYWGNVLNAWSEGKWINLNVWNPFNDSGETFLLISKLDSLTSEENKKGFIGTIALNRGDAGSYNISASIHAICTKAYSQFYFGSFGYAGFYVKMCVVSYQDNYYLAGKIQSAAHHFINLNGQLFGDFDGRVVQGATVVGEEQEMVVFSGHIFSNGDAIIAGTLDVGGAAQISSTTDSSTKDTGALVVKGGVGIEKNLSVGGTLKAETIALPVLSADPSSPVSGQIWVRS